MVNKANDTKTSDKPPKRPGRNGNVPPDTKYPFSSENQPTSKAKKEGWAKRKAGQTLAKAILQRTFLGNEYAAEKKAIAEYLGLPEEDVTIEIMLNAKQTQKAIKDGDTSAFNAIMNRAHGMPKQTIENEGSQKFIITLKKKDGG